MDGAVIPKMPDLTDFTSIVTDATTLFTAVAVLSVSIIVFNVLRRIARKAGK